MSESRSVADALNSLTKSNSRGHVDENDLRLFTKDYFAADDNIDSDFYQ